MAVIMLNNSLIFVVFKKVRLVIEEERSMGNNARPNM